MHATEGLFVRHLPLYGVVGQLGMWGVIINGVQASITEHNKMRTVTWNGRNSLSLCSRGGFANSRKIHHPWSLCRLHSCAGIAAQRDCLSWRCSYCASAPLLYHLASSAYFNLSLLSSDFCGLLFGTRPSSNSPQTCA